MWVIGLLPAIRYSKTVGILIEEIMADSNQSTEYERSKAERRAEKAPVNWSIFGGGMMAIFTLIGLLIGGQVSTHDSALQLIEVMSPPLQMLAFATITATITMLALLLTMLGVIKQAEINYAKTFYDLIERISLFDTILLIASASLLTVLAIPITEAETEISEQAATVLYYILLLVNAAISGLLVAAVLMLFDAIKSVIRTMHVQTKATDQ
jgi:hypothetical protein